MIEYLLSHPDKILIPLLETVELTLITLVISVALAALLTILSVKFSRLGYVLIQIFSVIYSIPSLAVFALMIPVTGLGKTTAITVLVIYNQYLLLRNFITGINASTKSILLLWRQRAASALRTCRHCSRCRYLLPKLPSSRASALPWYRPSASALSLPRSTLVDSATCSSTASVR